MQQTSTTKPSLIPELSARLSSPTLDSLLLTSERSAAPLRVGVMADSLSFSPPFALVLDHIHRCNFASIEAVLLNGLTCGAEEVPAPARRPGGKFGTLLQMARDSKLRSRILYTLYGNLDRRKASAGTLESHVDFSGFLSNVDTLVVNPEAKGFVHRFPAEAVAWLREHDLDVILRFGFNIIRGDILRCARYGVWSYHHGDNEYYRGGPAHFWELYENNPTSGVILQVLSEELDNGLILDKALCSTAEGGSTFDNRMSPYLTGVHMVIRNLHLIHMHGWEVVRARAEQCVSYKGRRKIYRAPTNSEMASFGMRQVVTRVINRIQRGGRVYHWRVGIRKAQIDTLPSDVQGVQWLDSPSGTYHADPFVISHAGKTWVFVEEYVYGNSRGRISCMEFLPDGATGPCQAVLDEPFHLSYPFVFEDGGEMYMIPESAEAGFVALYRAVEFPWKWEREKILLKATAVDTNVFVHGGRYWLLTSVTEPTGAAPRLCLFHASALHGEWEPHPLNPLTADIRVARNAGKVFSWRGDLYRPAQDGSVCYGYAVALQRITTLTADDYREETTSRVLPPVQQGIRGVHTFQRIGDWELFDCVMLEKKGQVFGPEV